MPPSSRTSSASPRRARRRSWPQLARSWAMRTSSRTPPSTRRARFGEDLLGRARALVTAEGRDRAEAAAPVAAFGDLDVRPGRLGLRSRAGSRGRRTDWSALAKRDRRRGACAVRLSPKPATRSTSGSARRQLVPVALGHAARDDESRAVELCARRGRAPSRWTPRAPPR